MEELSRRWKILLVQDHPGEIRPIQKAVKRLQPEHQPQIAEGGIAAPAYLSKALSRPPRIRPNVILPDLDLPMPSGLEALAGVRSDHDTNSILAISAGASVSDVDGSAAHRLNANCDAKRAFGNRPIYSPDAKHPQFLAGNCVSARIPGGLYSLNRETNQG